MTPNGLPPGTILGAFEIVSTLGRGGMGAVYAAKNRITGDVRAVKVILPELVARPEFTTRFVREIRMAMAVDHPHLVRVFEPAMHGDIIFLPMELLQGESLAVFPRRQRSVSIEATNNLVQSIGSAIAALHAKGILHRDVKPSNVFLAQDHGTVVPKLLDLGAGKDVEGTEESTSTGLAIGSPHYMAPEQASGRRDLDGRVDQYALATLAYQLMTGARPYENDDTGHVLAKVLSGAPFLSPRQIVSTIPPNLEAVILKAMARSRDDRYASMPEFLTALHRATLEAMAAVPSVREVGRPAPTVPPPAELAASTGPRMVTADPSGTVQTGVSQARPPRSGLAGAAIGIAGGIVTVFVGLGIFRAVSGHRAPVSPPTEFVTPAAPATPATPTATPSATATVPPVVAAPPSSAVAAAPPPSASAAPPAPDEVDHTPPALPAPVGTPPTTPAAAPVAAPAETPPQAAGDTPPPPTPAPTAAPRPRPRPTTPSGPAPCKPTPGSPCL